jgi:YD repeat-containing protein
MAFHGLRPTAAQGLMFHDYGSVLAGVSANPAASVAHLGKLVRYLSNYRALVRGPHGLQVETSTVPLRTGGAGGEQPVDLQLTKTGDGAFAPLHPLVKLSIARTSGEGIKVGSEGLGISMVGADVSGSSTGGKSVFFPGVASDVDATAAPTLHGVDLSALLLSSSSTGSLRYRLTLPAGSLLKAANGGAAIYRGDMVLARVPTPSARDAQGSMVPVKMKVEGDELLLTVAHKDREFDYPLLVDPEIVIITESATGWKFFENKPYCATSWPLTGKGPVGAPLTIEASLTKYPYHFEKRPFCGEGGETERNEHEALGAWEWETSVKPTAAEFYDINLSVNTTREDAFYVQDGIAGGTECPFDRWERPPPTIDVLEHAGCRESRGIVFSLMVGEFGEHEFVPVTIEATLAVGAVLITEPWPVSEAHESEEYGTNNPGEPEHHKCELGYPVNCATGNQAVTATDLVVGGRGPALALTRTYNSKLAVLEISAPFGVGWTGPYSAHTHWYEGEGGDGVTEVFQNNGSVVRFEHVPHSTTWVPASPLVQSTLTGNKGYFTYTLPNQTKLVFESERLVSETDRNGNALTMAYNSKGQLESITDSAGRKMTFAYNSGGQVETAKDPLGHTVKYGYERGTLVSVTEPGESSPRWRYAYNSSQELTKETNALSGTVTTEYNGAHQVISQVDPMGRERKWEYLGPESARETKITEPNGSITRDLFNAQSLPTSVTRASGTAQAATTTYGYDLDYNLVSVTDPAGHTTEYRYDA